MKEKKGNKILPLLLVVLGVGCELYVLLAFNSVCKKYPIQFGWIGEGKRNISDWLRMYEPQHFMTILIGVVLIVSGIIVLAIKDNKSKVRMSYDTNMNDFNMSKQIVNNGKSQLQSNSMDIELQNIEKIKGYKELLDQGIISQEEFDIKKNDILKSNL